ncbi:ATP-binding cassette domain-containing protein [Spiroplasma endosymbiont of Aspidapion aeneum]|uniref:ABC transporter ATP-binding protein n=1 Tax=Spiroplasma endosymbiont of Aspidapion aeneum TaxID=3066276 RepID=UPI00313C5D0E
MVIKDITKDYGHKKGAFNININIKKGQIYGIIGPNGAGKTTLIRMIMGFIKPDSGEVMIDGVNTWDNSKIIMDKVGYVSGEIAIYEKMTGRGYFKFVEQTKNFINKDFFDNLVKFFEVDLDVKIKKLSKGNKQKIAIIAALIHDPEYIILDEPTSGLDPLMQLRFNELLLNLNKKMNKTILICSHIFQEVAAVCNRVCFLKDGMIKEEFDVDKNDLLKIENKFKEIFEFDSNSIFKT